MKKLLQNRKGDNMNRRGFTLVETIIAVAIMSLLVLILIPNVLVLIDKNNEKSCNTLIDNIESATKIYVTNNKYKLGFKCNEINKISLNTLVTSGDLKLDNTGKIKNPLNDTILYPNNENVYVNVTYNCNNKEFIYEVVGINCNN